MSRQERMSRDEGPEDFLLASELANEAVAAENGKSTGNNTRMIVGLTTFASLVLLGTFIGVEEATKKPNGLSTNAPGSTASPGSAPSPVTAAPNTFAPVTPAGRKQTDAPATTKIPATTKTPVTAVPNTFAPATPAGRKRTNAPAATIQKSTFAPSTSSPGTLAPHVSPANSVEFIANETAITYSCGKPAFLNVSWVSSETCAEILAADTLPGRIPSSDPTFNSIVSIASGGGIGEPACTHEEWCNPAAEISCNIMPASGLLFYLPEDYCKGYNSLGASSSSSSSSWVDYKNYCVDGGKLPCLMDPAVAMFNRVVDGCKEVKKGNMTAVCGQDGSGSTFFNTTQFYVNSYSCGNGNTTLINTGFFNCRDKGRGVQRSNPKVESKYPRNMPLRASSHR